MDFDVPKIENICSLQKMAIEGLEESLLHRSYSSQTLKTTSLLIAYNNRHKIQHSGFWSWQAEISAFVSKRTLRLASKYVFVTDPVQNVLKKYICNHTSLSK